MARKKSPKGRGRMPGTWETTDRNLDRRDAVNADMLARSTKEMREIVFPDGSVKQVCVTVLPLSDVRGTIPACLSGTHRPKSSFSGSIV